MEHKIVKQEKNVYMGRENFSLVVTSAKNPTKKEVVEMIKKDEALSIVRSIRGGFGNNVFNVEITVYDSKEAKDRVETITRKTRKKMLDEAKKAAEAAKGAQ